MTGFVRRAVADLMSLMAAVERSTIVVVDPVAVPAVSSDVCMGSTFADWCASRKTANLDAEILAWIASHVTDRDRASRILN